MYPARCTLRDAPCAMYPARCTLCDVPCAMYPARCTLRDVRCVMVDPSCFYVVQVFHQKHARSDLNDRSIGYCVC